MSKILGDYHTHTIHSDGESTVSEMVHAAKERELLEIAVTEHGPNKWYGKLKTRNWTKIRDDIRQAGEECGIKSFFGIEANITGVDGRIDISQERAKELDLLAMGIHMAVRPANIRSFFCFFLPNYFWSFLHWTPKGRIRKNTEVVKRALNTNNVTIWTHPNLYFKLNVVEVAEVCADRGTLIELNGQRISFRPIDFERMLATGAKFIINSDAHSSRRVGVVDRVFEFLKYCDYAEGDISNIVGTLTQWRQPVKKNVVAKEETGVEAKTKWWKRSKEKGKNEFYTRNKRRTKKKSEL